jgi:hypothetical protein
VSAASGGALKIAQAENDRALCALAVVLNNLFEGGAYPRYWF